MAPVKRDCSPNSFSATLRASRKLSVAAKCRALLDRVAVHGRFANSRFNFGHTPAARSTISSSSSMAILVRDRRYVRRPQSSQEDG